MLSSTAKSARNVKINLVLALSAVNCQPPRQMNVALGRCLGLFLNQLTDRAVPVFEICHIMPKIHYISVVCLPCRHHYSTVLWSEAAPDATHFMLVKKGGSSFCN